MAQELSDIINGRIEGKDYTDAVPQITTCKRERLAWREYLRNPNKCHDVPINFMIVSEIVFDELANYLRVSEPPQNVSIIFRIEDKIFLFDLTLNGSYVGSSTSSGWYNPFRREQVKPYGLFADAGGVPDFPDEFKTTRNTKAAKAKAGALGVSDRISRRINALRTIASAGRFAETIVVDYGVRPGADVECAEDTGTGAEDLLGERLDAKRIRPMGLAEPAAAGAGPGAGGPGAGGRRRKTRRRGAGKKAETRHSPLARKLLVHRAYENVTMPTLKKDFAAAQVLDAELARKVNEARTPEARESLRNIQVEHAKKVLEGVKSTTAAADAAKSALRKEFNAKGGTRRRRYRGGQDKFSPLAKRLMTSRNLEKGITPEMRENAARANAQIARLTALAEGTNKPQVKTGILEVRERLIKGLHPQERESVAIADRAKAQLAREFASAGGTRRRKW